MGTDQYGRFYWCVKVPKTISKDGEIYLHSDRVEVAPDGSLVFHGGGKESTFIVLALAPGKWSAIYAASMIDGAAVAVEHWAGEVNRG